MKIGVLKEIHAGEKRVATTPEVTEKLIKLGFEVKGLLDLRLDLTILANG